MELRGQWLSAIVNKLCGRLPQYASASCKLTFDLLTLKVVSECDVGYHCAKFSLPRPLCSRLMPEVRDVRHTSLVNFRNTSSLNASTLSGRRHNNALWNCGRINHALHHVYRLYTYPALWLQILQSAVELGLFLVIESWVDCSAAINILTGSTQRSRVEDDWIE